MDKIKSNKLYWIYLTGFFLILALPLLSFPPTFHPAAWGKSILFRIIFSVLIFFFIWEILFKKDKLNLFWQKFRRGPAALPLWFLIALFVVFSLATIFSLDPHFSFWGSPYRGGGFLTFGLCIIFAIFIFLNLRGKDWQKILDFTLVIGCLIAIIAIFQKLGLFSKYMVSYKGQTVSTMGGPIFFALYLLLLSFLPLSFGLIVKSNKKKIFYLASFLLLIVGIILAATRAVFLGLFVGLLFFIFFYPIKSGSPSEIVPKAISPGQVGISPKAKLFNWVNPKKKKKILWLKILTVIIIIFSVLGFFWLKTQPQLVRVLEKNIILGSGFERTWSFFENFSVNGILKSRGSGWKVAFEALKDRPLLGYGPENFSIGFDKFYDPTLPGIIKQPGASSSGWWDRGHSIIFDISVSAGIPALIIYLFLFGTLIWQLQKIKHYSNLRIESESTNGESESANKNTKSTNNSQAIVAHGLEATFIGYLVANFFSFDVFSTYLIFFLLIGYALYLIYYSNLLKHYPNLRIESESTNPSDSSTLNPSKYIFITILCFIFIWFIWSANTKPLLINKKINEAVFLKRNNQYGMAIKKMEKIMSQHTFIDNYLRLQYIDLIGLCINTNPKSKLALSYRAVEILEECTKLRPYYTRSWLYLGTYTNRLVESDPNLSSEAKEELTKKAYSYLEKAHQLSPKRPDIFVAWTKNYLISGKYQEAKEKAEECINFAPDNGNCWWTKALILIRLDKSKEASRAIKIASEKRYNIESRKAISQLIDIYANLAKNTEDIKYYQKLADNYQKLIKIEPKNFQFHASLSYVYKALKEYDKAREEAMIVMELSPESKANVEEFLKTLVK